jgi:hypothetical protein
MKYLQTVNLTGGVVNDITTTLATGSEPYSVMILDSSGNEISDPDLQVTITLSGGLYHLLIYSSDSLTGVKLKILY